MKTMHPVFNKLFHPLLINTFYNMTLGFTNVINGTPNYFIEKIWQCIIEEDLAQEGAKAYGIFHQKYIERFNKSWDTAESEVKPKVHSVRRDIYNRWRPGLNIHSVVNNRTPERFQFAPAISCTSVQDIQILQVKGAGQEKQIIIDGRSLSSTEREVFAWNDGFEGEAGLFSYFGSQFKGKLIHWTGLSY